MSFSSQPNKGTATGATFDYLDDESKEIIGTGAQRLVDKSATRELFFALSKAAAGYGAGAVETQNGKHIESIGLYLSAPKWVSAVMAMASEEERQIIREAWDEHVKTMFARIEARAKVGRIPITEDEHIGRRRDYCGGPTKRQGSPTLRVPAQLIGWMVHHSSARPTPESIEAGRPADPHLHSHINVFNKAWVIDDRQPEGGSWKTIDDWGFKNQAELTTLESELHFSRRMEELGYSPNYEEDRRGRFHSKITGLEDLCRFWSSNTRRKEDLSKAFEAEHMRPPTQKEMRALMTWTRMEKRTPESETDWFTVQEGAMEAGFDIAGVLRYFGREPLERKPLEERRAILMERLIAPNGLCANDAVFNRRQVELAVARCMFGLGFNFTEEDEFVEELITSDLLVPTNSDEDNQNWTTQQNLRDEWYIDRELRKRTIGFGGTKTNHDAVQDAVKRLAEEKQVPLDQEQKSVVNLVTSGRQLMFIEGYAGTGKTSAMLAAVWAMRTKDHSGKATCDKIISISTARDTAIRTGEKLEADRSDSVESFCQAVRYKKIEPNRNTVIFLDEAVMVDNSRMARLLRAAGPARIICIGDRKQLQSIGAGGWYADAIKTFPHLLRTLTKVHRQEDEADVAALFDLRSGKGKAAIANWNERGKVFVSENRAERVGKVVADYIAMRDAGIESKDMRVVLDGSNIEIDQINRILQLDALKRGDIEGEPLTVRREVEGREWSVYVNDTVSFIEGVITDDKSMPKIPNGSQGRVDFIYHEEGMADVWIPRFEKTFKIPMTSCPPNRGVHCQRLQGGEANYVFAMLGNGNTSLESGYSQASRCIKEVRIYLDEETHGENPVETITKVLSKSKPKISARARMKWMHARDHKASSQNVSAEKFALEDHKSPSGSPRDGGDRPDTRSGHMHTSTHESLSWRDRLRLQSEQRRQTRQQQRDQRARAESKLDSMLGDREELERENQRLHGL